MKYSRKLSKYLMPTLKENPKEAEIPSHRLMIRAGLIRKLASGIYEFLPMGLRVLQKIEAIIREELNAIDGQEMMMSALQPKSLWEESKRWDQYGAELMRLEDRKGSEFCLGPTHEEVVTHIVKNNIRSYKELPLILYQFQMKFRDEIRPRFGVMRAREFYMKDAYSFDKDLKSCQESYDKHVEAYKKIFKRCGLDFIPVEAHTGCIGGQSSHEFMVLADSGEAEVTICQCGFGANTELAKFCRPSSEIVKSDEKVQDIEEIYTPDVRTVEEVAAYLQSSPEKFIKTLVYNITDLNGSRSELVVLLRGDHELNEDSLACDGEIIELADEKTIEKITGGPLGFSGPIGLKYKLYIDEAVQHIKNAISGANKKDYHIKNINFDRDISSKEHVIGNFRKAKPGDLCPCCSNILEFKRGIEVGHTFLLGTKYSDSMGAVFSDENGKEKNIIMGCYGIGVSRVAAAAIEQSHDEQGIIWPKAIAPFDVMLIQLANDAGELCQEIFEELSEDYEVLWDDRKMSPGIKFKDAFLSGIPKLVIIGKNFVKEGTIEVQIRKSGEKINIEREKLKEILER